MTASTYALEKRIDLFSVVDPDPKAGAQFRIERIVSYDNGSTWVDNWVRNEVGVFSSSIAACITGDSLDTFIAGKGMDNKFWFARLQEYYEFKNVGFFAIGAGVFQGKPAICSYNNSVSQWTPGTPNNYNTSYNNVKLLVFGRGNDNKIWWAYSNSGGNHFDMAWDAIGTKQFVSSPACCCSADGKLVAVFAKAADNKYWWTYSTDGGNNFNTTWKAIGAGVFTSAPAACCSADGKRIYVFGKGNDNKIWWAYATNGVQKWDMAWDHIGEGVFKTMPSANCSWDGKIIHVFGKGMDNKIWQARTHDFGGFWDIAWRDIHDKKFPDSDL
jgi:hypothetical protein